MKDPILRIALPSIVSNITVPLLGLVDAAIVGHLGKAAYIGAIAVGGMMFNMIYWLFGFLRMGTGGLTAQAYGAGRPDEALRVLLRSVGMAFVIAAVFIVLQRPILHLVFLFVAATPEVESLSRIYFLILIWGAPAVMGLYSFMGWFLGMQNARYPMYISIAQNVVNIAVSLTLVMGLGWRVEGVAVGTLVAQYAGLGMALVLWCRRYGTARWEPVLKGVWTKAALRRFFAVNRDIFLRTLCLVGVTTCFTSFGTAMGDLTLAANTLLMQFFVLFSYIMDGFAYAGEALGGRYVGAADRRAFRKLIRALLVWGAVLAVCFTVAYVAGGRLLLGLLTNEAEVLAAARLYLPLVCCIPVVSVSAFVFDGLFIGATATRGMLLSMAAATASFFIVYAFFPAGNHALWTAFLVYLGMRGVVQGVLLKSVVRTTFPA